MVSYQKERWLRVELHAITLQKMFTDKFFEGKEREPWFVSFANFHRVNIPIMAKWLTNVTSLNKKLGRNEQYHPITWYLHLLHLYDGNHFQSTDKSSKMTEW